MGWGRKTIITVSSQTMPLMDAGQNPLVEAILLAILRGSSIPTGIIETILTGTVPKVDAMYRYAKDEYTLGLPSGVSGGLTSASNHLVGQIITSELSLTTDILVDYNFITTLDASLAVLPTLNRLRGFDYKTNVIHIPPNDLEVSATGVVTINDALISEDSTQVDFTYLIREWVTEEKQVEIPDGLGDTIWEVQEVTWLKPSGSYNEIFDLDPELQIGQTHCIAKFNEVDGSGGIIPGDLYWYYNISTNKYPQLTPDRTPRLDDVFLPVVPLRFGNIDLTSEAHKPTDLYQTSKKLLNKAGMDIDALAAGINANPGIADIDHAYVMFGINLQSDYSPSIRYLVEFFDYLHDISAFNETDFLASVAGEGIPSQNTYDFIDFDAGPSIITTQDVGTDLAVAAVSNPTNRVSMLEHGLNISINYDYITSALVPGVIGKIGFARKRLSDNAATFELQVTQTVIKRVTVYGLNHVNNIYRNKSVTTTVAAVIVDPDENNLVIPIHYGIANHLPMWKRNMMYVDSFQMIITSYEKTKTKWYQSGWFKIVMFIVAIVVVVLTWGTTSAWVAALFSAASKGIMALAIYILPAIVWSITINYAVKWLVSQLGAEWGAVLGIVIGIATIVINPSGTTNIMGIYSMPTAQICMQASTALISAGNELLIEDAKNIRNEMLGFDKFAEGKWEELELLEKDVLGNRGDFDPLHFTKMSHMIILGEKPDDMRARMDLATQGGFMTIHDSIPDYVTNALQPVKPLNLIETA